MHFSLVVFIVALLCVEPVVTQRLATCRLDNQLIDKVSSEHIRDSKCNVIKDDIIFSQDLTDEDLENLYRVEIIAGNLRIFNNTALTTLSGLQNIAFVGDNLMISENTVLDCSERCTRQAIWSWRQTTSNNDVKDQCEVTEEPRKKCYRSTYKRNLEVPEHFFTKRADLPEFCDRETLDCTSSTVGNIIIFQVDGFLLFEQDFALEKNHRLMVGGRQGVEFSEPLKLSVVATNATLSSTVMDVEDGCLEAKNGTFEVTLIDSLLDESYVSLIDYRCLDSKFNDVIVKNELGDTLCYTSLYSASIMSIHKENCTSSSTKVIHNLSQTFLVILLITFGILN